MDKLKKRNYPHIRLTSQSIRGHYYGAFENDDENKKAGYTVFISNTDGIEDSCECMDYVHGTPCYHLIKAKELEVILLV